MNLFKFPLKQIPACTDLLCSQVQLLGKKLLHHYISNIYGKLSTKRALLNTSSGRQQDSIPTLHSACSVYSTCYCRDYSYRGGSCAAVSNNLTLGLSYAQWLTDNALNQATVKELGIGPCAMAENRFACDYAKRGTSACKKCKDKLQKGELRLAKVVTNPFGDDGGDMKQYFHPKCLFETFVRARATTKIIEDLDDIEGNGELTKEDKETVSELITDTLKKKGTPKKATPKKTTPKKETEKTTPSKTTQGKLTFGGTKTSQGNDDGDDEAPGPSRPSAASADPAAAEKDDAFRQFRRLCADMAEESSYTGKTKLVKDFIKRGASGDGYCGDLYLLAKLLMPGVVKTVYNLKDKQLVKVFSQVFGTSLEEMVEDLEQGDVAETVKQFFEKSRVVQPQKKSLLSNHVVDELLSDLSAVTKEDEQQRVLTKIAKKSTANDLKMIVRLIKHDLRINAGAKHVLDALDANAYEAFKASRNLRDVVDRVLRNQSKPGMKKDLSVKASLMTPIQPMLAEACKSVSQAFKRCPNGMYAEIKYDGERVQLHKNGDTFNYFSRSLKPVQPHKVNHFKDYIPKAFPTGSDIILDCEVLMIDTNTGNPLPFGTLGVHKKTKFQDAQVCLFVFDCVHYNGENLLQKPLKERREIMQKEMIEIPNRVLFSEMEHVTEPAHLKKMLMKVFGEGLEGLVLKDVNGPYEPGKRHWLKVKKDYLAEGAMADTADLVVLGAFFGTGSKGGLMSIFLMGVYDPMTSKWCTVTKCGNGFDDKTLDKLQKELDMVKISKDSARVPRWLNVNKTLIPDFVVADPKSAPVWEITGAEFSKSDAHTAGGVSIRFPRVTKVRDDKTWEEATNLPRLLALYKKSKEHSDVPDVLSAGSPPMAGTSKAAASKATVPMDTENDDDDVIGGNKKPVTPKSKKRRLSEEVENGEESPAKKSKPSDTTSTAKPLCKHGAKCYRKNAEHRAQYDHSEPSPGKGSKGLPSVFKGMTFHLPKNIRKHKELERYIIAFDGDVVPDYDASTASHVIIESKEDDDGSGRCVTDTWVWDCIKKKSLVPVSQSK